MNENTQLVELKKHLAALEIRFNVQEYFLNKSQVQIDKRELETCLLIETAKVNKKYFIS